MRTIIFIIVVLFSWPAYARCPHGQVLLVHKHQCMDRAAFRAAMHHTAAPPAPADDPLMHNHGLTYVHVVDKVRADPPPPVPPPSVDPCSSWKPSGTGWPGSWITDRGLPLYDRWRL